jgi:hypothetical protein
MKRVVIFLTALFLCRGLYAQAKNWNDLKTRLTGFQRVLDREHNIPENLTEILGIEDIQIFIDLPADKRRAYITSLADKIWSGAGKLYAARGSDSFNPTAPKDPSDPTDNQKSAYDQHKKTYDQARNGLLVMIGDGAFDIDAIIRPSISLKEISLSLSDNKVKQLFQKYRAALKKQEETTIAAIVENNSFLRGENISNYEDLERAKKIYDADLNSIPSASSGRKLTQEREGEIYNRYKDINMGTRYDITKLYDLIYNSRAMDDAVKIKTMNILARCFIIEKNRSWIESYTALKARVEDESGLTGKLNELLRAKQALNKSLNPIIRHIFYRIYMDPRFTGISGGK